MYRPGVMYKKLVTVPRPKTILFGWKRPLRPSIRLWGGRERREKSSVSVYCGGLDEHKIHFIDILKVVLCHASLILLNFYRIK